MPESNFRPRSSALQPAVAALVALTCIAAAGRPLDSVASAALQQVQSHAAQSISVAVVLDNHIVGSQSFGNADADTAFSTGSVSKMFTAVSVLQLVQAQKIALDGDAATYLPQYPALGEITVRQLLEHTSGLPNYADDAIADGSVMHKTTPGDIIASMLSRPRDFSPGADWNYSNTGYVVLGQIVERVSGLPLAAYENDHIFKVADMRHSFVAPALGADVAAPFDGAPGDWSWYYACGDVFSTAQDLARFDIALMQARLLEPATFAEMQKTVPFATLAPGMKDGLGVFVASWGNVSVVGHHGGEPGYRADNEMVPGRGFAVAVVGSGNYNTNPIVARALHAYLGADLRAPLPAAAYIDGAPAMTARLKELFADLSSGHDDRSQMDVLAAIGVPAIVSQMKTYGAPTGLRFLSKAYTSSGILYEYQVMFQSSRAVLVALIDKSGKFAELALTGQTLAPQQTSRDASPERTPP